MSKQVKQGKLFRRDLKRVEKQGKNLSKFVAIVDALANDQPLANKHRPHPLTGNWKPCWECHIEPDWLLIYWVTEETVMLMRIGSHAELFRK